MQSRAVFGAVLCIGMLAMVPDSQGKEPAARDAPAAAIKMLDGELAAIVQDPAHSLASLSVLAVRGGKVIYQQQFGSRSIDNSDPANNRPANRDTLYRIASISKLIVTLGVMRLVEDGKLTLDADISDYLGYKLRNPHFPEDPFTLRMLLSHTSSLRDDGGYYWEAKLGVNFRDVLLPGGKYYGKGEMWASNAKPGTYFQYANLPWGLIGLVMERVTGERFDRLMRRLVLDPMGLRGGFHPADFSAHDLSDTATLYRKGVEVNDKMTWNPAGPWIAQTDNYRQEAPVPRAGPEYAVGTNGSLFGPMGNCRLTADGLGKVMLMLMNDGVHEGKAIFRRDSIEQMFSTQWRHDGKGRNGNSNGEVGFGTHRELMNAWGLGMHLFQDISGVARGDRLVEGGGFKAVGHLGDAWGLTSAMVFDRATKNGMIFLIGGPAFDPDTNPGKYSSMYRHEEKILTAIYKRAILGDFKQR
ncbi:MAG: serine hydrolase domain-containing protein [Betaproteobacteria bacterium]